MHFDREGFYREVGLLLQLCRKSKGLTQREVASALGVPRASYANVERGRQRVPVDLLWRAAVYLRIPITKLLPEPISGSSSRRLQELIPAATTGVVSYSLPESKG